MHDDLHKCKDCGTSQGMDWWVGRHAPKPNGNRPSASARCLDCYNAYARNRPSLKSAHRAEACREYYRSTVKPAREAARQVECSDCGSLFDRVVISHRCPSCRLAALVARRSFAEQRRRTAIQSGDRSISWRSVGERDGWSCHLCGKAVPMVPGTAHEPRGATVDHLVPIAADGLHEWTNVALAHRECNLRRSDKGAAQLRLVG